MAAQGRGRTGSCRMATVSVRLVRRARRVVPEVLHRAHRLPVFARRNGFFDYSLRVSEPIALGRRAGPESLEAAAQQALSAMQACVRQCPTQWFHFADDE